ncbi:MAG: hypothetical protein JXA10_07315 [Anaerolineae bacterium]|nr:hypothetical protein [Anaerolineae bacterium]
MAHIVTEWHDDAKTIMRVTYQPGWTWRDLEANLPTEEQFLDSVDHKVDVIADFRDTQLPPGAISHLPKIAQSPPYVHPNSGEVVMVGSPIFMEEVVGVYKRVYGQASKLTMVHDLHEAQEIILKRREEAAKSAPQDEADDSGAKA